MSIMSTVLLAHTLCVGRGRVGNDPNGDENTEAEYSISDLSVIYQVFR